MIAAISVNKQLFVEWGRNSHDWNGMFKYKSYKGIIEWRLPTQWRLQWTWTKFPYEVPASDSNYYQFTFFPPGKKVNWNTTRTGKAFPFDVVDSISVSAIVWLLMFEVQCRSRDKFIGGEGGGGREKDITSAECASCWGGPELAPREIFKSKWSLKWHFQPFKSTFQQFLTD